MNNNQLTEVAKILGVSEDSVSAMDDEIKNSMTAVFEQVAVKNDEDKKAVFEALDNLWQKGSIYIELSEVAKSTGITTETLRSLDYETQQTIVYEFMMDSSQTARFYDLVNKALAVADLPNVAKLIGTPVRALRSLPRRIQENICGAYAMEYDADSTNMELIDNIREIIATVTDFPYIGGIEVSAIKNREFIRIETDKAQAIVVALDKSNIPFSARFGDAEMVLTYDGSYKEQVEEIIAKAQSGDYEALLRELQVYGVPDGYYRLLGEVAELLNTTVSFLQSRPDDVQLLLCKFYVDLWLCDRATLQRELDRIVTVNGRTLSDISEYERKKQQEKTPAEPVQTADKVHSFAELYDEYQRRHANDHFTREAHKHLAEIALRRQRDEQERVTQTEEREQKGRTDHEEVYHHRKCGYRSSHNRSCCHRKAQKVR